jgi:hypothetical protein
MLKKYDDATGAEMPIDGGLEVSVLYEGQSVASVRHFASWETIPEELLRGGRDKDLKIVALSVRDVATTKVQTRPTQAAR